MDIYIIALLILSVIFICGIVSIRSMTSNSVIADASAVKERNVILENRLKQEAEYNKKQQRKMQDFIENIAHQIKTPLAAIILNLEFMQAFPSQACLYAPFCAPSYAYTPQDYSP